MGCEGVIMMTKKYIEWQINWKFSSDWLIKGPASKQYDSSPLLDGLNRPYIPGSTIKGNLRHQTRKLVSISPSYHDLSMMLFGQGGNRQGSLYFSEGMMSADLPEQFLTIPRTRIAMDRKRKVVRDQAINQEELATSFGSMTSTIYGYVQEKDVNDVLALISLGILSVNSLGSGKSVGHGEIMTKYSLTPHHEHSTFFVKLEDEQGNNQQLTHEVWESLVQQSKIFKERSR